jgi:putative tryptophan/tyrosine transport system substrate-binding protein
MKRRDFVALIGGAAGLSVMPLVAGAEEPATRVLGFMSARSPEDSARELAAFRKGLEQNGLTEGRNLKVEYRWAHGDYSRLPALAAELVRLQVGVLLAVGGDVSAFAANAATSTIQSCSSWAATRSRPDWSTATIGRAATPPAA